VLFLHEVHWVAGARGAEFDAAWRKGWLPTLAQTDDARLLWYLRLAHGSGGAYVVVTVTGVSGASAWADLADRVRRGDLADWAADMDALRYRSTAKILVPLPWSPLQEVSLASVPTSGEEHPLGVYMEDTAWPFPGKHPAYVATAGTLYNQQTLGRSKDAGRSIIEMEAAFQPLFGTHGTNEVVLWQKVVDHQALLRLLVNETPSEITGPGTWMHDALALRDQWESRLLRTTAWSPLY